MFTFNLKTIGTKLKKIIDNVLYYTMIFILFGGTIVLIIDTAQTLKENNIEFKSLFPLTISNQVGNSILYEREVKSPSATIEYNPLEVIPPSTVFSNDSFLNDLANEINADIPQLLQEKQELITSFFKTNEPNNHMVLPSVYQELMMLLPLELLTRMKEDHLIFTFSEELPPQTEKGTIIATYYRKRNEIVFLEFSTCVYLFIP